MVSGDWITLLEHVVAITSCFDTADFASEMKLTKLPLIHCFEQVENILYLSLLYNLFKLITTSGEIYQCLRCNLHSSWTAVEWRNVFHKRG